MSNVSTFRIVVLQQQHHSSALGMEKMLAWKLLQWLPLHEIFEGYVKYNGASSSNGTMYATIF
jgi:hypothetical protein